MNKNTKRNKPKGAFQPRKSTKPKVAASGGKGISMSEQRRIFYRQ